MSIVLQLKNKTYCLLTADLRMLTQVQLQGMKVDGLIKTSFLPKTMHFCHRNLRSFCKGIEQKAEGTTFIGYGSRLIGLSGVEDAPICVK